MVRTALYSVFAGAGFALSAASADAALPPVYYPQARTGYFRPATPVCRHFSVMYRSCAAEPWRCYRTYESSYKADRVSHRLRHRGYETRIVFGS